MATEKPTTPALEIKGGTSTPISKAEEKVTIQVEPESRYGGSPTLPTSKDPTPPAPGPTTLKGKELDDETTIKTGEGLKPSKKAEGDIKEREKIDNLLVWILKRLFNTVMGSRIFEELDRILLERIKGGLRPKKENPEKKKPAGEEPKEKKPGGELGEEPKEVEPKKTHPGEGGLPEKLATTEKKLSEAAQEGTNLPVPGKGEGPEAPLLPANTLKGAEARVEADKKGKVKKAAFDAAKAEAELSSKVNSELGSPTMKKNNTPPPKPGGSS